MDLLVLKKQINDAKFPKETSGAINNIFDIAMSKKGELTNDEKQEIVNLIEDAILKNQEESERLMDVVFAIQNYQDAFIESVNDQYALQLEEDEKNKNQPAPPASAPNPSS